MSRVTRFFGLFFSDHEYVEIGLSFVFALFFARLVQFLKLQLGVNGPLWLDSGDVLLITFFMFTYLFEKAHLYAEGSRHLYIFSTGLLCYDLKTRYLCLCTGGIFAFNFLWEKGRPYASFRFVNPKEAFLDFEQSSYAQAYTSKTSERPPFWFRASISFAILACTGIFLTRYYPEGRYFVTSVLFSLLSLIFDRRNYWFNLHSRWFESASFAMFFIGLIVHTLGLN